MVKRGEVRWGETPKHGRRPYLILTRDSAIGVLSEILVEPLTKAIRPIPTHVLTVDGQWSRMAAHHNTPLG